MNRKLVVAAIAAALMAGPAASAGHAAQAATYEQTVRSLILKCLGDPANKDMWWHGLLKEGTFHYRLAEVANLTSADKLNGVRWRGSYYAEAAIRMIDDSGLDDKWFQAHQTFGVEVVGDQLSFEEGNGECKYAVKIS